MYCNNCGNEVAEGTKFCPNCGALIGINSNINVANSQQTYKGNGDDEKENIFRKIISPKIYYPAMIVLVILTVIAGKFGSTSSTSKDYDLSKLMGTDEAYVVDYFDVSQNEMGMYPNDNAMSILCEDGVCTWVNLSDGLDNYNQYNFAGAKVGDDKDKVKAALTENGFEFVDEQETSGTQYLVFTDKNRYTITASLENDSVQSILYMTSSIDDMMESVINEDDYQELSDAIEEEYGEAEETNPADNVLVDAEEEGADYDYSALSYAGRFEGWGGYSISFSPYTYVDTYEIGIAEIYYEGELSSIVQVFLCDDPGDWEGWDYDNLYEIRYDGYNEYFGFYMQDGTYMLDYNGPTKNYDTLEMIEGFDW